jgi:Tfp pilus assembly protein PilF
VLGTETWRAKGVYERALRYDPRQGEALVALAKVYEKAGRIDDARRFLLRAKDVRRVRQDATLALERLGGG